MKHSLKWILAAAAVAVIGVSQPASAEERSIEAMHAEIEETLGFVPEFFQVMPESGVAGLWTMMKRLQMNSDTALSGKTKELIALAVAAQIPCQYCVYAHIEGAKAQGATDQEIGEAVAVAATVRMGSTLAQGMDVDLTQFKADFDRLLGN